MRGWWSDIEHFHHLLPRLLSELFRDLHESSERALRIAIQNAIRIFNFYIVPNNTDNRWRAFPNWNPQNHAQISKNGRHLEGLVFLKMAILDHIHNAEIRDWLQSELEKLRTPRIQDRLELSNSVYQNTKIENFDEKAKIYSSVGRYIYQFKDSLNNLESKIMN